MLVEAEAAQEAAGQTISTNPSAATARLAAANIAPTPPCQECEQPHGHENACDNEEGIGREHEGPAGGQLLGMIQVFYGAGNPVEAKRWRLVPVEGDAPDRFGHDNVLGFELRFHIAEKILHLDRFRGVEVDIAAVLEPDLGV